MPQWATVGEITRPVDGYKNATVAWTIRIWYYGYDGSLCVCPSAVINIPPGSSNSNISTTIQNPKGLIVPINVSRSSRLVLFDYGWLNIGVVTILCVGP